MSNHYHVVLHVDHGMAKQADAKDIVKRWHQLYKPKDISLRYLDGDSLQPHELVQIDALIDTWRAPYVKIVAQLFRKSTLGRLEQQNATLFSRKKTRCISQIPPSA